MDHRLSETQELLRRSAADFFAQQYPLDRLRELQGKREGRDPELWHALVALGWTAAPFAEEVGGFPGSLLEAAPLLDEMGRAAYPSPYLHSCVAAGLALAAVPECRDALAKIAAGEWTVAWCGPTGLVPAVAVAGGKAEGKALAVAFPGLATHFLLETDGGAAVLAKGPGVSARNLDSAGAETLGEVVFEGAPVMAMLPRSVGEAAVLAGAAGAALMLFGASQRALELAVEYAKLRVQFGQPIGAFQALQHKCADMLVDIEVMRGLVYKAAAMHGTDGFGRAARYAKAFASDAAKRVTRNAIQLHGGVGFIDNNKVQLPYRLTMNLAAEYETAHEHRAAVTERVLAGQRA